MSRPKVAFICVHNACRSQIAEALGKHLAADVFESYSAGSEVQAHINPDAVRLLKQEYGIDMLKDGHHSKTIKELLPVDIAISMGCGVKCPFSDLPFKEDWGLLDPSGQNDEVFLTVIKAIEQHIYALKALLKKDCE